MFNELADFVAEDAGKVEDEGGVFRRRRDLGKEERTDGRHDERMDGRNDKRKGRRKDGKLRNGRMEEWKE